MAAHYESKHGLVALPPEQLYMGFTDMRNLTQNIPAQYRDSVEADYDSVKATVHGFTIAVKVTERRPYSLIRIEDDDAPFHFCISAFFEPAEGGTEFFLVADADLNLMMKAMLGGKIKEGLDKIVDGLVAISHGERPADFPSDLG